jgi:hypothetical protein
VYARQRRTDGPSGIVAPGGQAGVPRQN